MKTKAAYQEALRTYLILKNYSAATVSAYGCAFRQFWDWRTKRKYGADFTPEQARQYLLHRYEQGLKWQTINGDYSAIVLPGPITTTPRSGWVDGLHRCDPCLWNRILRSWN